ncbi:copper transporter [Ferviditalea candida]|uniref:Copper transporter n=1 Tax=Ferviditalea candida TaxID=3108399 RepID=A0ABU5ZLX0_9BACL|nr:copper transporter [Paenibacillaceae bacterium T2]
MLTSKYHIASLIAIFIALGIGILLGGTLGQQWMHETEQNLVKILVEKYDRQVSQNQLLQKQIVSLQMMNQSEPILENKKIVWIRPSSVKNEMLQIIMKSAGADWSEQNAEKLQAYWNAGEADTLQVFWSTETGGVPPPDIIVISDPKAAKYAARWYGNDGGSAQVSGSVPKVIDMSAYKLELTEPKQIVDFILYLKKIIREESHEAFSYYHYTGVE